MVDDQDETHGKDAGACETQECHDRWPDDDMIWCL